MVGSKPAHQCPVTAGQVDLSMYAAVDGAWRALHVSAPARRALVDAGYTRLEQLNGVSRLSLAMLHGMGPKAIEVLCDALHTNGMQFHD